MNPNRKERRAGALLKKGQRDKQTRNYVPIGQGTALSGQALMRGRKVYEDAKPSTRAASRVFKDPMGLPCKRQRRWTVMVGGVLRGYKTRAEAVRRQTKKTELPVLV